MHSEGRGRERLPKFLSFEERAREAGVAGLNTAVTRIFYPENALDSEENGAMWIMLSWPYAKLLRDKPDRTVAEAAHNGLYFGAAVGSYFVGSRTLPPYPFDRGLGRDVIRQQVLQLQDTYLKTRPTLKMWLDRYIQSLDPSGTCQDVITAVFSVTLNQLEEIEFQGFVDAVVAFDMGDI